MPSTPRRGPRFPSARAHARDTPWPCPSKHTHPHHPRSCLLALLHARTSPSSFPRRPRLPLAAATTSRRGVAITPFGHLANHPRCTHAHTPPYRTDTGPHEPDPHGIYPTAPDQPRDQHLDPTWETEEAADPWASPISDEGRREEEEGKEIHASPRRHASLLGHKGNAAQPVKLACKQRVGLPSLEPSQPSYLSRRPCRLASREPPS